ncbi:MAG: menaquinone biosynthesis family protein [Planctomycetota bacterium]|jgi:1,4-dihydroxy-6-naphthoate synthase
MPRDERITLRLGHSPDPDDAFMWWPLFELDGRPPRLDTGRWRFDPVMQDIETLNQRSAAAELEITALSCAQYARVLDDYALTACGASLGEGYGPKLVARSSRPMESMRGGDIVIAVPGERTTAFAVTSLMLGPGSFRYESVPFEAIPQRVASGEFEAGVVIHEAQLTFASQGLHLVADLGTWWTDRTGLPLPLGVNAIRLDLAHRHGPGALEEITDLLRRSVEFSMEHRDASIEYAQQFGRGLSRDLADEFVTMYVNRWTLDFGEQGRAAVTRLLADLHAAGLVPASGPIRFVGSRPDAASDADRAARA